jgi:xanthine dehydrogenase YagR molybdenum-binding subunit
MSVTQSDPLLERTGGVVGRPISRLDGEAKVRGAAPFAAEFTLDGLTYAALVFSTVARGRITTLDTAEAEAAPGVVLVLTHHNAPPMNPAPLFLTAPAAMGSDELVPLRDDTVHWNGQPIALVLAETQEQADHAASLIRAQYLTEPATTEFDRAKQHARQAPAVLGELDTTVGDAETALAQAAARVDQTYRTPRHNHNAIEPHAVTATWEGDTLRMHDSTQGVTGTAWTLAQVFDLADDQVRVTSPFVGGGFGGKTLWWHQILAAAAARVAGRPVRMTLSREGVYRVVGGRANTEQRVALGAGEDGRLTAVIHTGTASMTSHNAMPEAFITATECLYGSETFRLNVQVAELDMLANTFMRAPGEAPGTFALECAMDELAEELSLDPVELRLRNDPPRDPIDGRPFSSRHFAEAFRAGAERFGWDQRNRVPGSRREGEWLIGHGCASATYPYQRFPGGRARLTLSRDSTAVIETAAHEMGMGTATVQAQIAADRLGLPLAAVSFHYGDSAMPGNMVAGGSAHTASVGAAVAAAYRSLVEELVKLIGPDSPLAGATADTVEGRDSGLVDVTDPGRHESYESILGGAGLDEVSVEADASDPEELEHRSMHSFGAQFCEVRVNAVTGEPRVSRFVGSFDCGRILNPKTATSQFRGGIIMGLGMALAEETAFDERSGRIMNPSLAEYHIPVHLDVPDIDVIWTDIPDPHTPMGARGVGEIGITGVAAAVANAIYNATVRRVRDLPITLDKLLM